MKIRIIDPQGILSPLQNHLIRVSLNRSFQNVTEAIEETIVKCLLNDRCDRVTCQIRVQFGSGAVIKAGLQSCFLEDAIQRTMQAVQRKVVWRLFWSASMGEKASLLSHLMGVRSEVRPHPSAVGLTQIVQCRAVNRSYETHNNSLVFRMYFAPEHQVSTDFSHWKN